MKSKKLALCLSLGLIIGAAGVGTMREPVPVYAALEDNVGNGQSSDSPTESATDGVSISQDDEYVADWIGSQRGMNAEQMKKASDTLSPLTNLFGYVVGGVLVIIFAGIFVITALDLLYIAIPPVRNMLYSGGNTGGLGGMGMNNGPGPVGGMQGVGMMNAGGLGGMGMNNGPGPVGGMQGAGMMNAGGTQKKQWISDEAVACVQLAGGGQPQIGMNSMNGGQQVSQKSVINAYFKKRLVFMIILVVCAVVLTSSVLLGTGVNLAKWGIKIITLINSYIPK